MIDKAIIETTTAWPFVEARKLLKERQKIYEKKGKITLQTGYGPSGLPHIGTFAEVARTTMMVNAINQIIDIPTEIITFSDDMDGLRKIPENIPNKEKLSEFIGRPLTSVPDPFEKYESFGHHNNAKLRFFLDQFAFEYNFVSSTEMYQSGYFDNTLIKILENHEKILSIILPTLRSERKKTYSPFLPISKITGEVLQVKIDEYKSKSNSIVYIDPANNKKTETEITGGNCKLQWKVDWAMRWISLNVDYEMCGKDLTESVELASKVCKIMNKKPPVNLIYEMFLDEKGEKISKSLGNGIGVEEWLRYASPESLSYFMFQKPKSAKKLFFDVIPKSVDDYLNHLKKFKNNSDSKEFDSPVWHIHNGNPPQYNSEINFISIMNLVNICNSSEKKVIWGFIKEYDSSLNSVENPIIDKLIQYAINYCNDFIVPNKKYLKINKENKKIFEDILGMLKEIDINSSAEEIQTQIYEIGKKHKFSNLRDYFLLIYQVLFGQEQGPRLGSFIKLYGIKKTCNLLDEVLKSSK